MTRSSTLHGPSLANSLAQIRSFGARLVASLAVMLALGGACSGGEGESESDSSTSDVTNYGAQCEQTAPLDDVQGPVISAQSSCDSNLCVFGASGSAPIGFVCADDSECAAEGLGTCGENGQCNTAPSYIESQSYCSQSCEENSDCEEIPGCSSTRCTVLEVEGPYCCQRLCVCAENISDVIAASNKEACSEPSATCS